MADTISSKPNMYKPKSVFLNNASLPSDSVDRRFVDLTEPVFLVTTFLVDIMQRVCRTFIK